ncbi:hypothetical protein Gotri_009007, partial [Gossypium trilobum]|nr:hypothetical protein [Gossypium trilobum]
MLDPASDMLPPPSSPTISSVSSSDLDTEKHYIGYSNGCEFSGHYFPSTPASLGEFLEVERRFGDGAFYGATAELEGVMGTGHDENHEARNGRSLFADGR